MVPVERASHDSSRAWRSADLLRAFALFLALWVALQFLWLARSIVLIAILGVLFGIALSRAVDVLERFRIRRSLGAPIVLIVGLGVLVGAGFLVAPAIERQGRELIHRFPASIERIERQLGRKPLAKAALEASQPAQAARPPTPTVRNTLRAHMQNFARMLFPFLSNSIAAIAGAIVILFLAGYVAAEPGLYRGGVIALVPPGRRREAEELMDELHDLLGQWLVARVLAMIVIGLVTFGALALLGVPAAGALGLIAGIMEFVPFVGPIVAAIPAVAMALVVSPAKALYVVILFVVLQQFEGNLLTPLLMKNRLHVPPAITILAVSAFGIVFGVVGMLVAEPVSAAAILMVRKLYVERAEEKE